MLHIAPDQRIDPLTIKVLETVATVAVSLELSWFVAGAMAQDILLTGVYGQQSERATRDVDLAVAVASWEEFDQLKRLLLDTGRFREVDGVAHRLHYNDAGSGHGYPLDLLPFGGVEDEHKVIAWPPDSDVLMSVSGYKEAQAAAVEVEVAPNLVVWVASLPGLAVLKIFAWKYRGNENSKDAIDLVNLLRRYADAGNAERLYEQELAIMEAVDYFLELASARLLGHDVRTISTAQTIEQLDEILTGQGDQLISHMARGMRAADDGIHEAQQLLQQFRAGLRAN